MIQHVRRENGTVPFACSGENCPRRPVNGYAIRTVTASCYAAANRCRPTAHEQYLLELINRGRLDPPAEAARYGIDLNQGLAPGTITTEPKQPLACILRQSASLV